MPRATAGCSASPAASRPSTAQAVCEAVGGPWPRRCGQLVAVGRFAPAAARLLVGQQPIGPGHDGRIVGRHADGRQPGQRLPGAVDVVDAPAAEPTAVGLLRAADVGHGPIDGRIAHAAAQLAQRFQHAAGQVGRAGIDHGVVIGEGDVAEELAVVVAVESAPAAVAILHGQHPAQAAVDRRERLVHRAVDSRRRASLGVSLAMGRQIAARAASAPSVRRRVA